MKQIVIALLTILTMSITYGQKNPTEIKIGLDPAMTINESGFNFIVGVTTHQQIFKQEFRVGILLEAYPKRLYYGGGITLDYPIRFWNNIIEVSAGIELGLIFRDNVPVYPKAFYPHVTPEENQTKLMYYTTYGLNFQTTFWITNSIGLGGRLNFKNRPDLTYYNIPGDTYGYSGYLEIKIRIN